MDLIDGLKSFVATAQTGSFTEAAERLGISNRLTSKYVAQLEEHIGARLLQRTTRRVSLTPEGQELLSRAPALLSELDDLLSSVSEDAKGLTGQLRISAPVAFGEIYINDMLSRFASVYPQISIDLRLNDTHIDLASEGFDVAFRVGSPDVATLKARKLGEVSIIPVASQEYLNRNGTPLHPDELKQHACIVDTNRMETRWEFSENEKQYSIIPPRNLMVNSPRIARDWAINGRGIALCPDFVLGQALEDGSLVRLLESYSTSVRSIYAVYLAGNIVPGKVRTLIDFAVEDFGQRQFTAKI